MKTSVQITLIVSVLIVVLALLGMFAFFSIPGIDSGNTISVDGNAVVKASPDLVSVYFNVETKGDTAQEAKDKNSEIVDLVVTNLVKEGFSRDEIVTENFNIYPDYDWSGGTQKMNGYRATHSIKVELDSGRINEIGKVVDAGVDAGASISYISFELSQEKQNELKVEALELATKDAQAKAEGIARGLNKEVGRIVSVQTQSFDYYPWRIYEASAQGGAADAALAKEATTNITPGEREVRGNVVVVFKLK